MDTAGHNLMDSSIRLLLALFTVLGVHGWRMLEAVRMGGGKVSPDYRVQTSRYRVKSRTICCSHTRSRRLLRHLCSLRCRCPVSAGCLSPCSRLSDSPGSTLTHLPSPSQHASPHRRSEKCHHRLNSPS